MLIALINDTHWGARKSSKLFQDYFELFYKNIFFPSLEKYGISTVIHMGDAFDSRKTIDFVGLDWTRKVVLTPLSKYNVHLITGNHDCYLKNSNRINSPGLLLKEYDNIKTYHEPSEIRVGNLDVLLLPWINVENIQKSINTIQNTNCKVVMGHLELNGFSMYRGHIMEDGMNPDIFNSFTRVFSGHYHTRSNNGKIFYTGNPYEIYWNDVDDIRGFTIFDTESLEHFHIDNPYKLFYNIYYEDTSYKDLNFSEYTDKIVKVIVRKKTNQSEFDKFIDKLVDSNPSELRIVENHQIENLLEEVELESEDTFGILQKYIEDSDCNLNKSKILTLMQEIYKQALEIV